MPKPNYPFYHRTYSPQCYAHNPDGRALAVHRAPQLLKIP